MCLVCGESLVLGGEDTSEKDESLSFGEDIDLSENDSFDEDKIDFWWQSIYEPGTRFGGTNGCTALTCAKCGYPTSSAGYPIARVGDYLLIDSKDYEICGNCKNELTNHILYKRPENWIDPRKRDMWVKDYENVIKCPICSSTKVHKISLTNKAASAIAFGVLAAGHVSKTYKCDVCGSKF